MVAMGHGQDSWPSLHNGGNTSTGLKNLPLEWSPEDGVAWVVDLPGYGQSSPVVWGDKIYVTAIEGDMRESCYVLAFSLKTGKRLWEYKLDATTHMKNSYMVSRAAPTPIVDADGVYAMFESGDLHALSHDGQKRWAIALFDDKDRKFDNSHGYGASPTQTADAVIVAVDHRGPSYLLALSKKTGKELWKTKRTSRSSWTSPQVTQIAGQDQVVISSGGTVDGYDAATGKQLWSHSGLSGNLIPSVIVQGEMVYTGADLGNRGRDEVSASTSNRCLKIVPGSKEGYELVWKAKKVLSHYISPLAHRDHVYFLNSTGILYCLDAKTGAEVYAERTDGPCWAQPIAADDYIFLFHKDGRTTVLKAGPEFEVVAKNRLWPKDKPPLPGRSYLYSPEGPKDTRPAKARDEYLDPLVYGVAAVDGAFVIRIGTRLYCVGQPVRQSEINSD